MVQKKKKNDFEEVKYLYFIGALVIVSAHDFKIDAKNDISLKERRILLKIMKNELCISINVYDKAFPKILLRKCFKAVKINLGVKDKIYQEMFELN